MSSVNYWKKRLAKIREIDEEELIEIVGRIYTKLYDETLKDLDILFADFRNDAHIDYLNYDRLMKIYNNLSFKLIEMGKQEIRVLDDKLAKHYENVKNELGDSTKGDWSYISKRRAKEVAKQIWCFDGKNYSQRVWNNLDLLKQTLENALMGCFVRGDSPEKYKQELMRRFGVSYSRANTLIRTELAHCAIQAELDWAKEHGYKHFTYHTSGLPNVCSPECDELDGKQFNLDEAQFGVNIPPIHPNCNCYISIE